MQQTAYPCCISHHSEVSCCKAKAGTADCLPLLHLPSSPMLFEAKAGMLQDPLMQNAAFQDLCFLAEASGPSAWRRKMVFQKDNGETWQQLSTVCVDEVSSCQQKQSYAPCCLQLCVKLDKGRQQAQHVWRLPAKAVICTVLLAALPQHGHVKVASI